MKKVIFFLILFPSFASASVQNLTASGGEVHILAKGRPSFIKIEGKGSPAQGNVSVDGDKISGQFDFELASLETGIETRDKHMKDKYLEVEKYPKAHLTIQKVDRLAGWNLAKPNLKDDDFQGELTLHGVTRAITGKFSVNENRSVEAKFTVKLSDYKVAIPTFSGITVADDVDISVKIDQLKSF